jgi:hypothetical protein
VTALVLLFLVAPGDSDAPVTLAMRHAAIQVLGPATAIVIREAPATLSDGAAVAQGDALHAVVIVRLAWTSTTYLRAQVRLHLAAHAGWTTRDVAFDPRDAPAERGRALGYSVAAVVAGDTPLPAASIDETPRTTAVLATGRAPEPRSVEVGLVTLTAPARDPLQRFLFLDAAGTVSSGLGGNGGQVRLGLSFKRRLRLMLGSGARVGTVTVAQASSTNLYLTAGAAVDLLRFWRIALACRAEALMVRESLSHFSNVTAVKRARWLPGVRPQLEVSFWPTRLAAIIASAGGELTAGYTDVYVHGAKVAMIPASRLIAEVGLRVRF